jgi:hypothetical protein
MNDAGNRILDEITGILGTDAPIVETIQAMKDTNARLRKAVEWASEEMRNGNNRWFETSRPGEKYYDWFVRELLARAGLRAPGGEEGK